MTNNINIFKYVSLSKVGQYEESLNNINKILVNRSTKTVIDKMDKHFGKGYVKETIVPIILKLYTHEMKNIPDEKWLFKDYIKFLNTKKSSIKNEDVVNLYCESLIDKIKKEKINKGDK